MLLIYLTCCPSEPPAKGVQVREAAREEQLGSSSLLMRVQPSGARDPGGRSWLTHRRSVDRKVAYLSVSISPKPRETTDSARLLRPRQPLFSVLMWWSLIGCILCLYYFLCVCKRACVCVFKCTHTFSCAWQLSIFACFSVWSVQPYRHCCFLSCWCGTNKGDQGALELASLLRWAFFFFFSPLKLNCQPLKIHGINWSTQEGEAWNLYWLKN